VVNKLALSAHLGHSSETGWNEHDSSYYSKQNSVLSQGKILAILTGLYKHCKEPSPFNIFISCCKLTFIKGLINKIQTFFSRIL
jgi:hypothetical protein